MAFALTKQEQSDRNAAVERLRNAQASMDDARGAAEAVIADAINVFNDAVEFYNIAVDDAAMFQDALAARLEDELDTRSETWRDSEKGADAQAFLDEWQGLEFVALDLHHDIVMDAPEPEHAEALEQAPTRMENA